MSRIIASFAFLFFFFATLVYAQAPVFDELIHAYKDGTDIILEWQPAQNVDGYNIYRFDTIPGSPPWPLYAAVPTPGFRDTGAINDPADTLYYIVSAYNANGETDALNWAFRVVMPLEFLPYSFNNNHISFPYYYFPVGVSDPDGPTAEDVCADAGPDLAYVGAWQSVTDTWFSHICGAPFADFEIEPGSGYLLVPAAPMTLSIVGSHDTYYEPGGPNFAGLNCFPGTYCNNWISVPYHSMAGTAFGLCNELTGRGHDIRMISKWLPDQDTYFIKSCGSPIRDFDLTPGLGIMIQPGKDESIQIAVH
ncbi:hypothetical protein ACFLU6_05615 [Acidobacteriota bacterium]